jgi:hypothetical protein
MRSWGEGETRRQGTREMTMGRGDSFRSISANPALVAPLAGLKRGAKDNRGEFAKLSPLSASLPLRVPAPQHLPAGPG